MADVIKTELVKKQGKTRGKNPRDIEFEILNQIPADMKEFMTVTGTKEEKELLEYLYEGFNASQYAAASDEIGEFIPENWDKDTKNNFRLAVRNTSKLTGQSIEDVANFLVPGVEKGLLLKAAKIAADKAAEEAKSSASQTVTV